ncbi:hypothetical protein A9Q84_03355 [Halobacteriovorax marinus]|uniref:Carboxypeptidase regulatory-like domain-containing protein n=1 Tax=Halobacteriovorax marinus TaxID=97084 RepID=A0A1Y5F9V5_9BACT|nr:hypothetical protein A9Q84_03355 [Halobacteriovorax marinus]
MKLNRLFIAGMTASALLLTSCGGSGDSGGSAGASSGSTLSGIAATGAPVVNGKVEIKGKSGTTVSTTTNSTGSYSANIANLLEPFLIRITTPVGQKIVSVATASDVAAGKKINVTPLTHTIVANIFQNKDPDTLFDNFTTEAADYSDAKRETQKQELLDTLITAGVIKGAGGIITDTNIDLMNGSFVAGSGAGMDKLLDSLDVNTESGANIVIKIKGAGATIVNDDPTVADETPIDVTANIAAANAQLTVLAELKTALNNASSAFAAIPACNGTAVTTGACDKNALHTAVLGFMHTNYNWNGLNAATDAWSWFCRNGSGGSDATNAATCTWIDADTVGMKDVTIINHDLGGDTTAGTADDIVEISYNFYENGVFEEMEYDRMKKDGGVWKLLGNDHNYQIWPNSQSVHKTYYDINNALAATHTYKSEVQIWMDNNSLTAAAADNITGITLSVVGNASLQTALTAANGGSLAMKINNINQLVFTARECQKFSDGSEVNAAVGGANCSNVGYGINHLANALIIDSASRALMSTNNKFQLGYTDDTHGATTETYNILKPLKITSANSAEVMPVLGNANPCTVSQSNFTVSAPTGISLDYLSVYYYDNTNTSHNGSGSSYSGSVDLSGSMAAINGTQTLLSANFWMSGENTNGNKFVRILECY